MAMSRERFEELRRFVASEKCLVEHQARELIAEVERLQLIESRMTHTAKRATGRKARERVDQ